MSNLYDHTVKLHSKSSDFLHFVYPTPTYTFYICYYKTLVNSNSLNQYILPTVHQLKNESIQKIYEELPFSDRVILTEDKEITKKLLMGFIMLFTPEEEASIALQVIQTESRSIEAPQIEFSVIGPKEAFIESLDTNIMLIRRRLPLTELRVEEYIIGYTTQTRCVVMYIENIANPINIAHMVKRLNSISTDVITDSTSMTQLMEDNIYSLFPQFIETERPDRLVHILSSGGIAVIADGSSQAFSGPATLGQFIVAYEDYYLPWHIGSFFRILRIFAILFSILVTPMYIAVLTYHYQLIPTLLLEPIISSRINLPFPPVMEVIFMELTIELLREAGARLPSKIGQTIGIVGGIVLGTAAVQAALTSNILLILVALSALSSFTVPIFHMSNTIRVLRYPFIIAAAMLGIVGILICGCFLLTHLLRLKSLGTPFLQPFYPLRVQDWKDSIVRAPLNSFKIRPTLNRPLFKSKKRKLAPLQDIDE
ncbi:spore germination protein [Paenibacillus sp. GSMTC-2017]|uniref:spore germination protein n=1 Tax=Paenibacillus sp. GSMTC-2017 TaxID=2794350 RepID=UPI0018D7E7E7|nr:spore germination protein [Paenibacillus sp. GSMTC-2017]